MIGVQLLLASPSPALADEPVLSFDPPIVRYGVQAFEELTVKDVAITNVGPETLLVTVDPMLPDDFSALVDSTCASGEPTRLAPGERCTQGIGFRPTERFAPREVALVGVTATDTDGNPVSSGEVAFIGWSVPRERILDLSEHGVGPLAPGFFATDAVELTRGGEVALVQGDEAVLGPVALETRADPRAVTVTLATTAPGTAWVQVTAHGAGGRRLAGVGALVTEDDGYATLSLVDLPPGARTVRVTSAPASRFGVAEIRLLADPL